MKFYWDDSRINRELKLDGTERNSIFSTRLDFSSSNGNVLQFYAVFEFSDPRFPTIPRFSPITSLPRDTINHRTLMIASCLHSGRVYRVWCKRRTITNVSLALYYPCQVSDLISILSQDGDISSPRSPRFAPSGRAERKKSIIFEKTLKSPIRE